jgi:hypothetical protein
MMMRVLSAGFLLGVLFAQGCATMIAGKTEKLDIETNPSGARASTEYGQSCVTPCTLEVGRKDPVQLKISKTGYKDLEATVRSELRGWGLAGYTTLNLIMWPGIGDLIDAKTGANYGHKPNPFTITLLPDGSKKEYGVPPSFIASNRQWWGVDQDKTQYVETLHQMLVSNGLDPNDPTSESEYLRELNRGLRQRERSLSIELEDEVDDYLDSQFVDSLAFQKGRKNPNDVMVIIGNREYSNADIPNVDPAVNDAKAFRKYALNKLGIDPKNILYFENATYGKMVTLFGREDDYRGQLYKTLRVQKDAGRVFVYYSGHGAPSDLNGVSRLVPVDAEPVSIDTTGYSVNALYKNISQLPATERLVFIEACFSGGSQAGPVIRSASPINIKARPGVQPENVAAYTATSPGEIASWDEENNISLFTKYYLLGQSGQADFKSIGNKDSIVDVELDRYVASRVRRDAQRLYNRSQNPQFVSSKTKH